MLKGIPKIISPALLKVLAEMGHSDRIVIGDGNFPAESVGKDCIVIRADGHGVPELLDAILTLFPLDPYIDKPVSLMEVMPGDPVKTPIWDTYKKIIAKHGARRGSRRHDRAVPLLRRGAHGVRHCHHGRIRAVRQHHTAKGCRHRRLKGERNG